MLGRSGMNRIIAVLVALLMGSSWQIIVHQHEIRKLNGELEKERNRYSDLKLEYHRLELQNSKEIATEHIQTLVREKEVTEQNKKGITNKKIDMSSSLMAKPEKKKEESITKTEAKKSSVSIEDKKKKEGSVKSTSKKAEEVDKLEELIKSKK